MTTNHRTSVGVWVMIVSLFFFFVPQTYGQSNALVKAGSRYIDDALEAAAKLSGRTLSPAMRKAAVEALEEAAVKHGDGVLRAAREGGLELVEAAGKYGDDVWKFSSRVPAASRALAMRANELVPMTQRIGTEVLELEVKSPGIARHIVEHFGDDAVKQLARTSSPSDLTRLAGYAAKADSPATKTLLYETYTREGTHFLDKLSWKHIVAGGLSISMILGTYEVSSGAREGINEVAKGTREGLNEVAKNNPKVFKETAEALTGNVMDYLTRPVAWPIMLFGFGLAIICLSRIVRWTRRRDVSKGYAPPRNLRRWQ